MSDPVTLSEDTTDQTASTEDTSTLTLSPRDEVMANIVAKRSEEISPEPEVEEAKPVVNNVNNDDLVMLKVSGREIFKKQSEVDEAGGVDALQKSLAGNIRFEEAAEKERNVALRERNLQEERNRFQSEQKRLAQEQSRSVVKDDGDSDIDTKQMAEDMFLGDVDAVADNLSKIIAASKIIQPQLTAPNAQQEQRVILDPTMVANQAAEIIEQKHQLTDALTKFTTDYEDIANDPVNRFYANEQTKILMRENPNWSPDQVLTVAGERTRATLKSGNSELSQKQQRKAATVDNVAKATQRAPTVQTSKFIPRTAKEVFDEIKRGRPH